MIGGGAVLVAMTYLISTDTVRDAVTAQIKAATGLDVAVRGDTQVSLFPSGAVTLSDVVMGDDGDGEPGLRAERIFARLRFLPLLAGRAEISDISLVRPRIALIFESNGHSNWSSLTRSLAAALQPNPTAVPRANAFSEIRISDGTFVVRDKSRDISESLTDAELSLAWPAISKTFGATGSFVWHEKPVEVSVVLSDFVAALTGKRSGLKLRLAGEPLRLAFDGAMSLRPTMKIEGTTAADAASLRDALQWIGQKPLPGGGFGRFALKAQTGVVGGMISMSGVNVELDGNSAEGVFTFATDGRQTLQGTLAADSLDLSPYVSTVRLLTSERDWNRLPLALDGLNGTDLDLRLSAASIVLGNAKLGRTAIAANLRDGRLMLTVGESQAFNGLIQGSFALARSDHGADLTSQMQFTDVDLDSCMNELFGIRRLEGKGDLRFAIDATGRSVLGLARTVNGTASLTGRQGFISGMNIEQLLRRLDRRPLSGSGNEFRSGRTPFDTLNVDLKIVKGVVNADNVEIDGSAVRLVLGGSASIPARDLDLSGKASLINVADGVTAFELPFVVQGPWEDPIMLPDTQSLIRRSGAAAPLLNSISRERRARDAVRSAIERLTGGSAILGFPGAAKPAPEPAQ